MVKGTVLRIEKISPKDGQGLRTVVFLKGCPLRCAWCSTPESQSAEPEMFYKPNKCVHCGRCIKACPQGALSVTDEQKNIERDKNRCVNCFQCVTACPVHAMGLYGETMTAEQVMTEIRKESLFYFFSGGGVTLSGGDVLMQAAFSHAILTACKEEGIHTMAELDMFGPYRNIRRIVEYLDGYYADVKLMDSELHSRWTGQRNEEILDNIRRASAEFPETPLHVRVPLIPGINDSEENLAATASFCRELPSCIALEFLPYHRLGASAYGYLSRDYAMGAVPGITAEQASERIRFLDASDFPFTIQVSG